MSTGTEATHKGVFPPGAHADQVSKSPATGALATSGEGVKFHGTNDFPEKRRGVLKNGLEPRPILVKDGKSDRAMNGPRFHFGRQPAWWGNGWEVTTNWVISQLPHEGSRVGESPGGCTDDGNAVQKDARVAPLGGKHTSLPKRLT